MKEAEKYAPWDYQRFNVLCCIWDGMGHIRNKPMILVWSVDKKRNAQTY